MGTLREIMHTYAEEQRVTGKVDTVLPYGVFVRLPDGTRAYIRRRELSWEGDQDPRQVVSQDEEVQAVVVALPEPGRTMELSLRRLLPDPWEQFEQQYRERDTVTGTVKTLIPSGAFVQIIPGVNGFVPLREMASWKVEQPEELLWVGDYVEAVITRIDHRCKKVNLSIQRRMEKQAWAIEFTRRLASSGQAEPREELERVQEPEEGWADSEGVHEQGADLGSLGRALVVDDDKVLLGSLVAWMRRQGCQAEGAGSLTEALTRLKETRFDLVLADIDLSGEDGVGLIRSVKGCRPECPVAVISLPEWIAERGPELEALGIAGAFAKPLDLDELREGLVRIAQGKAPGSWRAAASPPAQDRSIDSFHALARQMRGGASLHSRLEAGLERLLALTRAEVAMVFHMDPVSRKVSIVAQAGTLPLNHEAVCSLDDSPVKDLIIEGGDIFELHVSRRDGRFSKLLDLLPFQSCIGVPIQAAEDVHHALFLFHREPEAFSRYRLRDAHAMAVLFSAALESDLVERRAGEISRSLVTGDLAASFGHEVYNKISGLEIQVRNLRAEYGRASPAEMEAAIDTLLQTVLDTKRVAVSFRNLIRAEEQEEIDINDVIRRAELLLRPVARKHKVRISTRLAPDLPKTVGSAARLQQSFSNIMLNGIQHMAQKMERCPTGWGALEVTSSWEPEDAGCPIKVRFTDTGPGIHRRLWKDIFELGFSTRPGGTGLGLFVARSVVESMGGRIAVEQSSIPLGSTFLVELPGSGAPKHDRRAGGG